MPVDHVENLKIAEKAAFIVEQRVDDFFFQPRVAIAQQPGRQLVHVGDAIGPHDGLQRRFHPPGAAFRQDLAGARLKQAGKDAGGTARG